MQKYKLTNTELEVSRIALGTMHMGGSWDTSLLTDNLVSHADNLINQAVDLGINFIDLADIYCQGKSDEVVGRVLKNSFGLRDKLILQAKCGIIMQGDPVAGEPARYDFSYAHIVSSTENILKRLQVDSVDILQLHRPDPLVEPEEVVRAFDHLHSAGKVRYFGVSNNNPGQIVLLKNTVNQPLISNQVELSLLHHHLISDGIYANQQQSFYTGAAGTLDYCRAQDMLIQAWSPLVEYHTETRNANGRDRTFCPDRTNSQAISFQARCAASIMADTQGGGFLMDSKSYWLKLRRRDGGGIFNNLWRHPLCSR
jgi:predicted oxidoreductase